MNNPDVSFELVVKWFKIAIENCKKLGKIDSVKLWKDGLNYLIYLDSENKRLGSIIGEKENGARLSE